MELQDYLRIVRKRWITIVLCILLGVGAAALATFLTPRTYQATSEMFVSTTNADTATDLASGTTFMTKQIKTYADVVTSPKVLDPVKDRLGVEEDSDLASAITTTVPPDTVLIDVAVTDRNPAHAAKVANAVSEQFTKTVSDLQAPGADKAAPVKVTVVRPASTPTSPVNPKPARNLALGLALGALLGLGLALLRDRLDTSVKSDSDIKELTDTTLIGGIAFDPDAKVHPLIVQGDPHSTRAEAFRALRTNLQFLDADTHPRVIVFTSSLPSEGKTTTTANLALTIGATGSSVCVVEGDLRRPKLLEYMGLEGGVGLTSLLIGEAELDDVLQPFGDNVTALGAGPIPPNPSELLGSDRMAAVLERLRAHFDYVIIDAPPLLPVTDAAVVSKIADGTVLVVGRGVVKKENVARALEILETVGAKTLGVVMNRMPTKGADSYSYYGYRYAYTSSKPQSRREAKRALKEARKRGRTPQAEPVASEAERTSIDA